MIKTMKMISIFKLLFFQLCAQENGLGSELRYKIDDFHHKIILYVPVAVYYDRHIGFIFDKAGKLPFQYPKVVTQVIAPVFDHRLPLLIDGDGYHLWDLIGSLGLRKVHLNTALKYKRGSNHEDYKKDQDHVGKGRDVYLCQQVLFSVLRADSHLTFKQVGQFRSAQFHVHRKGIYALYKIIVRYYRRDRYYKAGCRRDKRLRYPADDDADTA